MCYITRDLLAADLFIETPSLPFFLSLSLSHPSVSPLDQPLSLIFPDKEVKHGSKDKDAGEDTRGRFDFLSLNLNVYHPDVCSRWADRARCCITKAESGLLRVREEQMCWMGFRSANEPHVHLFLDSVYLSSFSSLSLLKILFYWLNVLITVTWLPSHNFHYCILSSLLYVFYSPEQFTGSFTPRADPWMDQVKYLSAAACSFLPMEAGFLSIALQKYMKKQTWPVWCQQAGKQVTGNRPIFQDIIVILVC